jgi:hypothetical protein
MKIPTLKEKNAKYEEFLHKINMFCIIGNNDGIKELVENADIWSYMHRIGNGELSDRKQQQAISNNSNNNNGQQQQQQQQQQQRRRRRRRQQQRPQ